jgi:WD40 repeat protein
MAFSPDGKTLALPKRPEGHTELWNIETGQMRALVSSFDKAGGRANDVAFSKDGRFLAVTHDTGVAVWDLSANKEKMQIPVQGPSWVARSAFTVNPPYLVLITATVTREDSRLGRNNYSSVRWDVSTWKKEQSHAFDPTLLLKAISPDGRYALLQKNNQGQIAFDLETGKRVFAIDIGGGFRFSADGSILVSYDGKRISCWDVTSGRELRHFEFGSSRLPKDYDVDDCLAVSPNKKVLAVGYFARVYIVALISLESGKVLDRFECCPRSMFCSTVCFSPDGRILATDTEDVDMQDQLVKPLLRFWKIPESW